MKTILINGIDGFLGSELAKRFENNYNIIDWNSILIIYIE